MAETGTKEAILDSILEDARHFGGQLQHYGYDVNMPLLLNLPESPLPCRETAAEFETINASFSSQIHALFEALQEFESRSTSTDSDEVIDKDGVRLRIRISGQSFDIYPNCGHRNFHARRLFLHRDDDDPPPTTTLPQLQRVVALKLVPAPAYSSSNSLYYANARPVSLRVPLQLACHLPALRTLDCPWLWERLPDALKARSLRHYARPWEGPWRDARHEFGRAVRELGDDLPASLRRARLWFWNADVWYTEWDQSVPMPNLVFPEDADPVSLGLRTLAARLEDLDVRAFLTPDLFRSPVAWPRMKRLRVEFSPWCPDGTWYFVGPPKVENRDPEAGFEVTEEHYPPVEPNEVDEEIDEEHADDEDEDEENEYLTDIFRTEPLPRKIEPLLRAFAEALKGMPALDEAELFTWLAWHPEESRRGAFGAADEAPYNIDLDRAERAIYRWGVAYTPGKDGGKGQVKWQVGAWRPQEDILRSFEALGGETGGVDTVWKPFDFLEQRDDVHPRDWD